MARETTTGSTAVLSTRLESLIDGEVIVPDEAAASALTVHGGIPRRPSLIVRPRTAAEVARILPVIADLGSTVTTRGGGHSFGRHSVGDGAVVLDVSHLDTIELDARSRLAVAGGGVTAGAYGAAAGRHGLVTGFGDTTSVGIAGLTLGGGIGFLSRRVGLAIDQLAAAELALADGTVRTVDPEADPELFWAVRGGGPGIGVVTRLTYRLIDLVDVEGGMLLFEPEPALLSTLVNTIADAPDDFSAMVNVMSAPPAPFVPERLHGNPVIVVVGAHSGSPADASRMWDALRALAPVVADTVARMPYRGLLRDESPFRGMTAVANSGFVDGFDTNRAADAIAGLKSLAAPGTVVNIRPMGGAIARVPADATAFAHRSRRAIVIVAAGFSDPQAAAAARSSVDALVATLSDGDAGYANFLSETADLDRRAYPEPTLERLEAIRERVDPTGIFRRV